MPQVKEEAYELTQAESGVASTDLGPGKDQNEWEDLFRYKIPVGRFLKFQPNTPFSAYLYNLAENIEGAIADDGGVQTDETVAAQEATANDMILLPATPAVGDAYYFGYRYAFSKLRVNIGTAGVGTWTIVWEYYTGAAWTTITGLTDGTTAFTAAAGNRDVTFTPPNGWARTVVKGRNLYWIRARVSVYSAVTTQPKGTQAWMSSAEEHIVGDMLKIELRDAAEVGREAILNPLRYTQVREFQDVDLKARLDIVELKVAEEGMWVIIAIQNSAGIIDVSECYFLLPCIRRRTAIYA